MADVLILNGPNLNKLGQREPDVYGHTTLEQIRHACEEKADSLGLSVDFRQTNSEAEMIGWIQEDGPAARGILINPAAFTHTSVAILDALQLCEGVSIIEIHLSNIHRRESFRAQSFPARAADGMICGLGPKGYLLGLDAIWDMTTRKRPAP